MAVNHVTFNRLRVIRLQQRLIILLYQKGPDVKMQITYTVN